MEIFNRGIFSKLKGVFITHLHGDSLDANFNYFFDVNIVGKSIIRADNCTYRFIEVPQFCEKR